jgi:hypothetical protein
MRNQYMKLECDKETFLGVKANLKKLFFKRLVKMLA